MNIKKYLNQIAKALNLQEDELLLREDENRTEFVDPLYSDMGKTRFSLCKVNPADRLNPNTTYFIAFFSITMVPENVAWFGDSLIYERYRNKGVGAILNKLRLHIASRSGAEYAAFTVNQGNTHQLRIANSNGWQWVSQLGDAFLYTRSTQSEA